MKKIIKYIAAALVFVFALYYAAHSDPDAGPDDSDASELSTGAGAIGKTPKAHKPNPFKKHVLST